MRTATATIARRATPSTARAATATKATLDTSPHTGCVESSDVFQHPLIEDPPSSSAPAAQRREYAGLVRRAEAICLDCPLAQQCLYQAVVEYDVTGYCGGTTRKQRQQMRTLLGITVEPEDLDTLAGVQARHRQVDHNEVVRLRNANPHESLETLARRLGCSLSTVKRHLRKARGETKVTEIHRTPLPSMAQVLAAYRQVTAPPSRRDAA